MSTFSMSFKLKGQLFIAYKATVKLLDVSLKFSIYKNLAKSYNREQSRLTFHHPPPPLAILVTACIFAYTKL